MANIKVFNKENCLVYQGDEFKCGKLESTDTWDYYDLETQGFDVPDQFDNDTIVPERQSKEFPNGEY